MDDQAEWRCFAALGELHFERREISEALYWFQRSLVAGGDRQHNLVERWACWMMMGQFERAWKESDAAGAFFGGEGPGRYRRVVIRCLRGLGDAIQFLRYAPLLRARCEHITVQAPRSILPLLAILPGIDETSPLDEFLDGVGFDFEIECSSLPYLFRTTLGTIPSPNGYIELPPEHRYACGAVTAAPPGRLKVGISWAGGTWNPIRTIPLPLFAPLMQNPQLTLFSLQKGPEASQLHLLPQGSLIEAEHESCDILHTCRLILDLDLIISIDTMVAHLAGALGKPVWTLLPHAVDWRWMLGRADSPWYSSMRLFRQPSPGDWQRVIQNVAFALAQNETDRPSRRRPVAESQWDRTFISRR